MKTGNYKPILMGLLTSILSLFGCVQNEKTNNERIPTPNPGIYPSDHKLTMEERKNLTNKFLRQKGIETLESLPCVEDYTDARFRDQREVACKSVVLYGLIYVSHNERDADEMISYFKKYHLWEYVSPDERKYLEKSKRTDEDNIPVSWRIENLNVLLWALGNFDTLSFPTEICDFRNYKNLPNLDDDPTEWISNAKLRDREEILNEMDMIYRIHWATREASLNSRPSPAGINDDIVMERHFALNWLVMYADDWDDITTDT